MWNICIKADTNDADHIEYTSLISDEVLEDLKPLIEAIKNFKEYTVEVDGMEWTHHHNYPHGECCRQDLGELIPEQYYKGIHEDVFEQFDELLPYNESGFHTIKSIVIYPEVAKTILL